ncbi:MAG: serine hydrolase domain-containing protein [Pseudomonadales bacterium]
MLQVPAAADPLPRTSPEKVGMSSERLERITTKIQEYVDTEKFPGVLTMVNRGGKIVHVAVAGNRGLNDNRRLRTDDLFRIYSMTKPITAVAAMQLYEQGKFQLSDPVSKFVPELKDLMVMTEDGELEPATHETTMHELLTHTSGFSYGFLSDTDPVDKLYFEADLWSAKDLTHFAEKLAKLPLQYQPGTKWHYSVAVDVTGLVVERISGMPFDEYLEDNIFKPLDMDDTFFQVPANKLGRFLPNHYYNTENEEVRPAEEQASLLGRSEDTAMVNYEKVTLYSGGGGLVSTAMDYMRFAEMLRNGGSLDGARILGPKTIKFMATNHLPAVLAGKAQDDEQLRLIGRGFGFGLGFGVVTDAPSLQALASNGAFSWGGAAGTIFWVDPVEDLVVVGMIQLMMSPWPFRQDLRALTYQALTESYGN